MIAKSLIVNGAARFLNKIYANDLQVNGTTSFTDLSVSGISTFAGKATFNGHVAVGYNNTASDGTLSTHGLYSNEWLRSVGNVGWYSQTYHGGIYMKDTTYVRTYNSKSFFVENGNLYVGTTSNSWNSSGNLVTSTIKATSAIIDNLYVPNELRAVNYNIETVSHLGGAFFVAPTIEIPAGDNVTVTSTSNTTIKITIDDNSINTSTFLPSWWAANSLVKISGSIAGIPIGTCSGSLDVALKANQLQITFTYTGQTDRPLQVSNNRQRSEGLSVTLTTIAGTKPIGIYMTALGSSSWIDQTTLNKTSISIYGGTIDGQIPENTNPVARIGNLKGLPAVNGISPQGWGIYTRNGYFDGVIISQSGKIGGWSLGTNAIFSSATSSPHNTWDHASNGLFLGNTRIAGGNGGTWYLDNDGTGKIGRWEFTSDGDLTTTVNNNTAGMGNASYAFWAGAASDSAANAPFSVTYDGSVTATKGTIGGATISNGVLQIKEANISGTISGSKITATSISADRLNITDLQAIGASIGGFAIDTTSIHTKNVAVTSNADNSIALSSADFTRTINTTERTGLRFAIGDKFGVTGDGIIYAANAVVVGSVVANTGRIGGDSGWTIATQKLSSGTLGADSSMFLGTANLGSATIAGNTRSDWRFTVGSHFGVTNTGAVYANSANITGTIIATSGSFGNGTAKINIGTNGTNNANSAIYYGMSILEDTTNNGFYIGTDGIALGKGAFKVTSAGVLTATKANITGTITGSTFVSESEKTVSSSDIDLWNGLYTHSPMYTYQSLGPAFVETFDELTAKYTINKNGISVSTVTNMETYTASLKPYVDGWYTPNSILVRGNVLAKGIYLQSTTSTGYYLTDSSGKTYGALYQNTDNLWIGARQTADWHHRGGTYISSGHNGTQGNETIYISVPNAANNGGTNYGVYHKGNLTNATTSNAGLMSAADKTAVNHLTVINLTATRTTNSYITASDFRVTSVRMGNLAVTSLNCTLSTAFPKPSDFIQIGTITGATIKSDARVTVPTTNGMQVTVSLTSNGELKIYNHSSTSATGMIRCQLVNTCS